jgi:hypothetical protein
MEIQYTIFNKWINLGYEACTNRPDAFEHLYSAAISDYPINFTDEDIAELKKFDKELSIFNGVELNLEIPEEINLNTVNIQDTGQIIRYYKYLIKRITDFLNYFESTLKEPFIDVENDYRSIDHTVKSDYKSGLPTDIEIHSFLFSFSILESSFNEIIDLLETEIQMLTPVEHTAILTELSADRHKLILLHKIGGLEYLRDKYLNPQSPSMSLEDFARLIGNLIGAKSKELRSDVGKLLNEIADPKKTKSVQTESANRQINSFLASLGLPT